MTTFASASKATAKPSVSPLIEALQNALESEHAAVYGYGVVGARMTGDARTRARASLDAHRARRDALMRIIADHKATPRAAAPAYTVPFAVASAADATKLAVHLEDGVAAHLSDLVAASAAELRKEAAGWLRETAVSAVRWRGTSTPFPGLVTRNGTAAPIAEGRT